MVEQPSGLNVAFLKVPRHIRLWAMRVVKRMEFRLNGRAETIRRLLAEVDAANATIDQFCIAIGKLSDERDEAREAARFVYDGCADPHTEFEAGQRWPWLEEE